MTAEAFLRQPQRINRRIRLKLQEYEHTMDLATRITSTLLPEPGGSGITDRVGDAAARMADLSREVEDLSAQQLRAQHQVSSLLESLPEKEYTVLHGFFLSNMSAEEIGDAMLPHPLTARHVYRIRARALGHVQQLLDAQKHASLPH